MKKLLLAALAMFSLSTVSYAVDNEPEEGLTTQVFLGMTGSNIRGLEYNLKVGGTAGIKFEYMLPNAHGTYINAGLDWIMKGSQLDVELSTPKGNIEATNKLCPQYFEIPVHVGYRYNLSEDLGFYADFGPYFAVGYAGKNKFCIDTDGYREYESSTKFFKKKDNGFQRWDAGLGLRIGAEYNQHYSLNLGMDWGLTDMYTNEFREDWANNPMSAGITLVKPRNFSFSLSFGYRF